MLKINIKHIQQRNIIKIQKKACKNKHNKNQSRINISIIQNKAYKMQAYKRYYE